MARTRRALPLLCFLTLVGGLPAQAGTPVANVGGEWTGTIRCSFFKNGLELKTKFDAVTAHVAQINSALAVVVDLGGEAPPYQGLLQPSAAKPGQQGDLALAYCGTNDVAGDDPTFDELGRFSFKVKPGDVKGTFKGSTIVSFNGGALGDAYAGSCKWAFKRTTLDPQNVAFCAPG